MAKVVLECANSALGLAIGLRMFCRGQGTTNPELVAYLCPERGRELGVAVGNDGPWQAV